MLIKVATKIDDGSLIDYSKPLTISHSLPRGIKATYFDGGWRVEGLCLFSSWTLVYFFMIGLLLFFVFWFSFLEVCMRVCMVGRG